MRGGLGFHLPAMAARCLLPERFHIINYNPSWGPRMLHQENTLILEFIRHTFHNELLESKFLRTSPLAVCRSAWTWYPKSLHFRDMSSKALAQRLAKLGNLAKGLGTLPGISNASSKGCKLMMWFGLITKTGQTCVLFALKSGRTQASFWMS